MWFRKPGRRRQPTHPRSLCGPRSPSTGRQKRASRLGRSRANRSLMGGTHVTAQLVGGYSLLLSRGALRPRGIARLLPRAPGVLSILVEQSPPRKPSRSAPGGAGCRCGWGIFCFMCLCLIVDYFSYCLLFCVCNCFVVFDAGGVSVQSSRRPRSS